MLTLGNDVVYARQAVSSLESILREGKLHLRLVTFQTVRTLPGSSKCKDHERATGTPPGSTNATTSSAIARFSVRGSTCLKVFFQKIGTISGYYDAELLPHIEVLCLEGPATMRG
jgi:hypothetical protein